MRLLWLWGPPVMEMAAIFAASSMPEVPAPPGGLSDKVVHAGVYAVLAALLVRALARGRWNGVTAASCAWAIVIATAYGVVDEVHQRFVPPRSPELADAMADGAGAALAGALVWTWSIIRAHWAGRASVPGRTDQRA